MFCFYYTDLKNLNALRLANPEAFLFSKTALKVIKQPSHRTLTKGHLITITFIMIFVVSGVLSYCLRDRLGLAIKVEIAAVVVSAGALGWLMVGPRTYMLYLPVFLQNVFHPWVLGSIGFLAGLFAVLFLPMVLTVGSINCLRLSRVGVEAGIDSSKPRAKSLLPLFLVIGAVLFSCLFYAFIAEKLFYPPKDTSVFYRHISVDSESLHVTFLDPVPALPEPAGEFYWPFYGNAGCSVDHYDVTPASAFRTRYNALGLTGGGTLETRTKDQVLWRSDFGTVYGNSFYEYRKAYPTNKIPFRVYVYDNGFESEPPKIIQSPIPQTASLAAITLIRVFKSSQGTLFVLASYRPDGSLRGVSDDETQNGNWYPKTSSVSAVRSNEQAEVDFGIPRTFPIDAYRANKLDPSGPSNLQSLADCVCLHYDRNFLVARDVFSGKNCTSEILAYQKTYEDSAIPSDDQKLFAP